MADTYISENKAEDMNWSWGEALVMYTLSLLDDEKGIVMTLKTTRKAYG